MPEHSLDVVRSARLELPGIAHGFLGRTGGVSSGPFASLNVGPGSGDDPALLAENRRRAVSAISPGVQLLTARQVHSAGVVALDGPFGDADRPQADAMVTCQPGLALGILTADCTPVLLADPVNRVIGAAHAGWRGALAGVVQATVSAMLDIGADRAQLVGAVGPCIASRSYEVDAPLADRFVEADAHNERFFASGVRAGHFQFDLEGYVVATLARSGVRSVDALGIDTYQNPERYFSFRRSTHRGETGYGRQVSLIALQA